MVRTFQDVDCLGRVGVKGCRLGIWASAREGPDSEFHRLPPVVLKGKFSEIGGRRFGDDPVPEA